MQLRAVLNVKNVDSMSNSAQLFVGNFLSNGVGVPKVEVGVNLSVRILTIHNSKAALQVVTRPVLRWVHFTFVQHYIVPSRWNGIRGTGIRCNLGCVKIKLSHIF